MELNEEHKSKRLTCHACGSSFASPSTLSRHKDVHSTTRRFVCALCGKSYKQLAGLRAHQTLHTGNGHKCEICNKVFLQKTNLRIHMDAHNKVKSHECRKCSRTFTQSGNLRNHAASVHNSCYRCGTKITSKHRLMIHLKNSRCDVDRIPGNSEQTADHAVALAPSKLSRSVVDAATKLKSVLVLAQNGLPFAENPQRSFPYERKVRTYSLVKNKKLKQRG